MKFILVSRFWDKPNSNTFRKKARVLSKSCRKLLIPYYIEHQPHLAKIKYLY